MVRELAATDHLPDYQLSFDAGSDTVVFTNRGTIKASLPANHDTAPWDGALDPDVYGDTRNAAPGWDVYFLEREWRGWLGENEIIPRNPERHFVKFCQSWFEKRGEAR
jgi:hypothetical protein